MRSADEIAKSAENFWSDAWVLLAGSFVAPRLGMNFGAVGLAAAS